jgi:3-oxoacyl-[acyl-carrier-protein] synthase-3
VSVYLHGLGHFHPSAEITNKFLEDLDIGTTDAWIMERVGIRTRRTVLSLDYLRTTKNVDPRAAAEASELNHAQLGARAAHMAIERAGLSPADIGMVISGGSAPDLVSPAEACGVGALLGIEAPAFDVMSACTSFFVPLYLLSMMDPARLPAFILLVIPETITCTVDYRDRSAAVLWGDAAAAAVVSTQEHGRAEILGANLGSSPAGAHKVSIPRQGFFRQDGKAVQKFAIKTMTTMVKGLKHSFHSPKRAWSFVGHQANLRMLEHVCASCDISTQQHFHNLETFGNTAAAGSLTVLSQRWDKWNGHDDVSVAGVGAGLTWGSYLLRFGH